MNEREQPRIDDVGINDGGKMNFTSIFEPTLNLRWAWVAIGVKELQQLWVDRMHGDQEWRTVPEVEV